MVGKGKGPGYSRRSQRWWRAPILCQLYYHSLWAGWVILRLQKRQKRYHAFYKVEPSLIPSITWPFPPSIAKCSPGAPKNYRGGSGNLQHYRVWVIPYSQPLVLNHQWNWLKITRKVLHPPLNPWKTSWEHLGRDSKTTITIEKVLKKRLKWTHTMLDHIQWRSERTESKESS